MEKIIQNLHATDSAEVNQYPYNGSLTYFDRQNFQVQIEKEQMGLTVTKPNNAFTGVLFYQPKN